MHGLRKMARALAIVVLPVVGSFVVYQSTSATEVLVGLALIAFALGLFATWFWQPW